MGRKKTLNLAVPEELLGEFNAVCAQYGHAKQKGMVLSAAVLMFLRADPHTQGRFLEEVLKADISEGVQRMIRRAKTEQALTVSMQDALKRAQAETSDGDRGMTADAPRTKKAAKKAGRARTGVKKLPKLDDLK